MKSNRKILVVNFVMDRKHPLLSHQYEAVTALAEKFDHITVITGKVGNIIPNPKIRMVSSDWIPGRALSNLIRLYFRSMPLIIKGDFTSVFYHMTDLQCALLSPLIRIRKRRQFLWYAHTFKSRYLSFSSIWVDRIITSTYGSCPMPQSLVTPIGQAIDEDKFKKLDFSGFDLNKFIHIGRFDKSKNIETLISNVRQIRKSFPEATLTLIGSTANQESKYWSETLIAHSQSDIKEGWLLFRESIPRDKFRTEIARQGCFLHAYIGSLDKTLIESTMLGIPVVSVNPEYLSIFGSWSGADEVNLVDEYLAMRRNTVGQLQTEIARRHEIACSKHSLDHWISELTSLLE